MFGEKVSRALDGISDAQLESAMGVYERKKRIKYIWVRVIALLIVLAVLALMVIAGSIGTSEEPSEPQTASALAAAQTAHCARP